MTVTVYGYVDDSGFVYPPTLGRDWDDRSKKSPHVKPITDIAEYKRLVEAAKEVQKPGDSLGTLVDVESRVEREARQRDEEQRTGVKTRTQSAQAAIKQV